MSDSSPLTLHPLQNMQSSDNEILWQKYYPQEAHVATWNRSPDIDTDHMNLASNQLLSYSCNSGGSVSHKTGISGTRKPIRRRSRASKKTPITLLNANCSNFRALVQQFTGCHSTPSTCYKGPVTLNFERGSSHRSGNNRNSHQERAEHSLVSFDSNFVNNINAFTSDIDPLFASTVTKYAPSGGDSTLTLENFDMESFSSRELPGPGDYCTSIWETTIARNDDSWSYS